MSLLSDASAFREAIASIVREEIRSETRDCFRVRKAVVTTAANATVMGVTLVGDGTELFLPFSSAVSSASVGDVVWVGILFGSMRNAFVWQTADFSGSSGPAYSYSETPNSGGGTTITIEEV